jgi:hypothetical protein
MDRIYVRGHGFRTLLALLLLGAVSSASASAAITTTGTVKYSWTIPAGFTAHIATNYLPGAATFSTGSGTIRQSTSAGSGTCTSTAADAYNSFTLTFGALTPGTGPTGCTYLQGLGISVNTNDANGYAIYEAVDTPNAGAQFGVCVFPDGGTASASTPASSLAAAPAAATFTGATATGCAGSGVLLNTASGTITNPGGAGDVGSTTAARSSALPSAALFSVPAGTPANGTNFYGEDVQLNIPGGAPSLASDTQALIVYFVPG